MPGSKGHTKHTVWLDPDHFQTLKEMYPGHNVSAIIRLILDGHIEASGVERVPTPTPLEVRLDGD